MGNTIYTNNQRLNTSVWFGGGSGGGEKCHLHCLSSIYKEIFVILLYNHNSVLKTANTENSSSKNILSV